MAVAWILYALGIALLITSFLLVYGRATLVRPVLFFLAGAGCLLTAITIVTIFRPIV